MTTKYFNVKGGIQTGNVTIDAVSGNLGNVGTITLISTSSANLGNAAIANYFVGNGVYLTSITGANVTGYVPNATNANAATVAGTVLTAYQPNITGTGILANLSVSGNTFFSGPNVSLGNVSNLHISGGDPGYVLQTDGFGVLTFVSAGSTGIAGLDTQVQYNNAGSFGATAAFTFNRTSNTLTVQNYAGNGAGFTYITGANVSGNVDFAKTSNWSNIANSVGTLGSLSVTGNINAGNLTGATYVDGTLTTASQTGITTVGTLSGVTLSSNGNITMSGSLSQLTGANLVSATNLAGTITTASQTGITTVGTLGALTVTGNIIAGNATIGSGTGGSIIGANLVSANYFTGNLTTASQTAITQVGLLTGLTVNGNINVYDTLKTNNILGNSAGVTITATGTNQNVTLVPTGTGVIDASGFRLNNLHEPSVDSDAATKYYVDHVAQGLHIHTPVAAATITGQNLTGYAANVITLSSPLSTLDTDYSVQSGDRILVKNQTTTSQNGIYVIDATLQILTRAPDANTAADFGGGDFVFVVNGFTLGDTGWVETEVVTTLGTDPIIFQQFSGAGSYSAGTGLTLNGTVFKITDTTVTPASYGNATYSASFTVNQQGQLTAASASQITANAQALTGTILNSSVVTSSLTSTGVLTSLSVSGNINSGNLTGATYVDGTLTTASQTGITQVGTLASLSVTGNTVTGNANVIGTTTTNEIIVSTLTSTRVPYVDTDKSLTDSSSLTWDNPNQVLKIGAGGTEIGGDSGYGYLKTTNANVGSLTSGRVTFASTSGKLVDNANLTFTGTVLSVTGNVNAGNITGTTYVDGTLTTAYQPNITGVGTLANATLSANGNITMSGSLSQLTGANLVSATYLAGTLTTAAQPNITSVSTLTSLSVSGNINAGNITGTTYVAGTLTTAAQPNITSLSVLTSLSVSGSANVGNLKTDYLLYANGDPYVFTSSAGGSDTQVQFNDSTVFAGSAAFTFDKTSNTLTVQNYVGDGAGLTSLTGANVTGQVANALVAGTVYASSQSAITSVGTLTDLSVSGISTLAAVKVTSLNTNRSNISVTTATVIDQFTPSTYRTAKYIISASGDDGYQSVETLLVHDGANAYITIYGSVCSNAVADLVDISSNVNGTSGNVTLYATSVSPNAKVNVVATYIMT